MAFQIGLTYWMTRFILSCVVRKSAFCICKNKGADQLCVNRTADQCLCFLYTDNTIPPVSKLLADFCDFTAWFVSDLVGHPKDGFSRDTAHFMFFQVSQISLRERRNSEHISQDQPDSPLALQKALQVNQCHLLAAVSKMRPSVSAEERLKYKRM